MFNSFLIAQEIEKLKFIIEKYPYENLSRKQIELTVNNLYNLSNQNRRGIDNVIKNNKI